MSGTDVVRKAGEAATEAIMEQMERELLAAWRAGYDWLHVYDDELAGHAPGGSFTVRKYVLPTDSKRPPEPERVNYSHSYDLRDVDGLL